MTEYKKLRQALDALLQEERRSNQALREELAKDALLLETSKTIHYATVPIGGKECK